MKERPILFNGPMVRAILDGNKTQTRRVVTHKYDALKKPPYFATGRVLTDLPTQPGAFMEHRFTGQDDDSASFLVPCPFGTIGDRLWLRETHEVIVVGTELFHGDRRVDGYRHYAKIAYRADDGRAEVDIDDSTFERLDDTESKGWTPSIHMPRWASRITLEVTGVRVERLQAISEADAEAEGISFLRQVPDYDETLTARDLFHCLWDAVTPKGADWNANPWVWVIEFQRINGAA